jgi:two-component system, NarL family, nitrate/nitrite response regulator NarL
VGESIGASFPAGAAREVRELAHDVIQPAATISALVAAATQQRGTPALVGQCLDQIADESRYLAGLCRQALTGSDHCDEVAAADVLADAVLRSARATWPGTITLVSTPVRVVADSLELRRALTSLVDNACRAAGPKGQVEVHVVQDTHARIEVHDSGPGLASAPPDLASLGLGVARRVAEGHGGTVTMVVSPLGGACVRIEFPAFKNLEFLEHHAVEAGQRSEDSPGSSSAQVRLLLCEEQRLVAAALAAAIEAQGYTVAGQADTLAAALTMATDLLPDLCLIDLSSVNQADLDAIRALRAASPSTRVVVLTAASDEESIARILAAGASGLAATSDDVLKILMTLQQVHAGEVAVTDPSRSVPDRACPRLSPAALLTPRESEVLHCLVLGLSTPALAKHLEITYATARSHVQNVLMKLGVHSQLQAVAYARAHGRPG